MSDLWRAHASALAEEVTEPDSRWREPVAAVPRHELVPRWWDTDGAGGWVLRHGAGDVARWLQSAYANASLVTRVGALHADHADSEDRPVGLPTSSATLPGLVVRMLQRARLGSEELSLLDLGTGAGGLAAYASQRLGSAQVTSMDVDAYVTRAARERLGAIGLHPEIVTADATAHCPGTYDRVVATVGLPAGPGLRPVLGALRPGGRLVITLARTSALVTGWKEETGDVIGRVERDWAGFMSARSGDTHPVPLSDVLTLARQAHGDKVGVGRYPVVDVANAWELRSMLEITTPGVEAVYEQRDRLRTAYLTHPDGSWARATAEWLEPPDVHQGGPHRLWDALERIRNRLNMEGALPLFGAHVRITPDGVVHFSRGNWRASMGAA